MDKKPELKNHPLDQELADFTDQVWSAQAPVLPEKKDRDPDLSRLEDTVLRVKNSFGDKEMDPTAKNRIFSRLVSEWEKVDLVRDQDKSRQAAPKRRFARIQPRMAFYQLGLALILLLIVAIFLFPEVNSETLTAASQTPSLLPMIFFL